MKQIRIGTFETNSSSTHTLVIVSKEEWSKFKNGEMCFDTYRETLVNEKDKEEDEYGDRYRDFMGYGEYTEDMDEFCVTHKTPNGEEIVVFGYYGYNG